MNTNTGLGAFDGQKYLSLETYRKNGTGIRTPVWFAAAPIGDAPKLYVYTTAEAGKVKRIRHNGAVRIAPCGMRGQVTGPWVDARAEIVTGDAFDLGMRLLNRKYRPWKQIGDLFVRLFRHHERSVLTIQLV